ncbi:MAG: L-threonylcarbamoyladenylate synthase [Actinomyces urogenitalis]|uniref:L-threonylcarbamoyladenylate synthase n=1 Tax=Actinomyces urogenitalis TaxID=103621 RepID=UPI002907A5C3|nr:L-threonylcarbamoyladenylate synthase [Actinomyces urogenitalis]MDU6151645.1 L-threonylcarbamoyladenylate synthase [Actinomyces urogenitalis]
MTDVNEDRTLSTVVAHVRDGGLVIIPTDTVYGIGTLASDAAAVARLLAAKGRGRQMPPPVLVAGPDQLDGVVGALPPAAQALMEAFWPGALTIILDAAPDLGWDLGETGGTIAVRMPDHPLALELLRATGPMAVTSANHTGQPPATDAASARVAFPGHVREAGSPGAGSPDRSEGDILLLDGGATPGPVPSTIVSLAGDHAYSPRIIRDGVLSLSQLAVVLDPVLTQAGASPMTAGSEVPRP